MKVEAYKNKIKEQYNLTNEEAIVEASKGLIDAFKLVLEVGEELTDNDVEIINHTNKLLEQIKDGNRNNSIAFYKLLKDNQIEGYSKSWKNAVIFIINDLLNIE